MKITATQLRQIIKEEVKTIKKNFLNESLQTETENLANAMMEFLRQCILQQIEVSKACELLMLEAQGTCEVFKEQERQNLIDVLSSAEDLEGVPLTLSGNESIDDLEDLYYSYVVQKNESINRRSLQEAMLKITPDEVEAWKSGDWGYNSGDKVDHPESPERFLHGEDPHDDEGSMIKSRLYSMKEMAKDVCDILNPSDQLPGWVQDHISVAHENIQQVHGYLMGKQHSMEREHGVMESKAKKTLSEAHNRVTREEMNAWMRGDWGFVSESHEEKLYDSDADWVNAIYDDNRTIDELLTAYHEMSDKGTTFGHEGDILNDYLNVGVNDVNDPSLPAELKVRVVQLIIELQDLAGIEKEQDVEQEKPEDIKTILRKKGIPAY